jgi:hypothetical protein
MDVSYPYSNTESVKREVDAAQSEHLGDDGEVTERHKDEVNQKHTRYHIVTDVQRSYLISYRIDLLVERLILILKHKLRPENAYFQGAQF